MTKSSVTAQSNTKIKAKASSLRNPINSPEIIVTKELNVYGKMMLVGIYTCACLFLGGVFFSKATSINPNQLNEIQSEQQKLLLKLSNIENHSGSDVFRLAQTNKEFTKNLEKKIVGVINKQETASSKIISEQREKIYELNNQLKNITDLKNYRKVASAAPQKTISYNFDNMSILRYEQGLAKTKFKQKQEIMQDAFLHTVNIKTIEGKDEWENFKDQQKIALYKFDQHRLRELREFRKNGYRIVN